MPNYLVLNLSLCSQLVLILLVYATSATDESYPSWRYHKVTVGQYLLKYYNSKRRGMFNRFEDNNPKAVCNLSALQKKIVCKQTLFKNLKIMGAQPTFVDDTNDSLFQVYACSEKKVKYPVQKVKKKKIKEKIDSLKLPAFYCPAFEVMDMKTRKTFVTLAFFISNGDVETSLFVYEPDDQLKGVKNKTINLLYYENNIDYAKYIGQPDP